MKKNKKIFKRVTNIIFYIIAFLALIIAAVFYYFVISLNMIPEKYIAIIIVLTLLIFILLVGLIILKKIKFRIKLISSIFLVLISLFFCLGIRYITKTISFMDIIDDPLLQKEEYQIMVLQNSNIKKTENLKDANVGVYNSVNADHAIDLLQMKVKVHTEHFDDITYMFEALESGKVDAVLVNNSIQNLLENELNYLELSLRSVSSVLVPIEHVDVVKVVDVTTTPFNVYIAGGDAYGSIGNVTNTDVNMIVSVDPVKKKMLLTSSIPRDYYVRLPGQGDNAYDKLTHAGYYGVQESILAVEDLLDVEINYYVKVNFSTIEGIVDAIGGVDVYSDYSFCAYGLPTPCYFKGYNHLDGYHALIFARERHKKL